MKWQSELCRLRENFCVLMILLFGAMLSLDSSIPTLHQYITNPREDMLNVTATTEYSNKVNASYRYFNFMQTIFLPRFALK